MIQYQFDILTDSKSINEYLTLIVLKYIIQVLYKLCKRHCKVDK